MILCSVLIPCIVYLVATSWNQSKTEEQYKLPYNKYANNIAVYDDVWNAFFPHDHALQACCNLVIFLNLSFIHFSSNRFFMDVCTEHSILTIQNISLLTWRILRLLTMIPFCTWRASRSLNPCTLQTPRGHPNCNLSLKVCILISPNVIYISHSLSCPSWVYFLYVSPQKHKCYHSCSYSYSR